MGLWEKAKKTASKATKKIKKASVKSIEKTIKKELNDAKKKIKKSTTPPKEVRRVFSKAKNMAEQIPGVKGAVFLGKTGIFVTQQVVGRVAKDTWTVGDVIIEDITKIDKMSINKLKKRFKQLGSGAIDLVSDLTYLIVEHNVLVPIILTYWSSLDAQALGKWRSIPRYLQNVLQPYFNVRLSDLRYAVKINTVHGKAITFGNKIYFPSRLSIPRDIWWLIHEIQHCEQYRRLGGVHPFIKQYAKQVKSKVIKTRSFGIHDILPLEREASLKADELTSLLEQKISYPVFDPDYYLKINKDVAKTYGSKNRVGAVNHWLEYGIDEGRKASPNFDVIKYINEKDERKLAFGKDFNIAIDNFTIERDAKNKRKVLQKTRGRGRIIKLNPKLSK